MAFFAEGNFYMDGSYLTNSTISNNIITTSTISGSTINMLSTSGNFQVISNTASPILPNDVAIKNYVDQLGIIINDFTLLNTTGTIISMFNSGSYVITVRNNVANGPSAIFNITKNQAGNSAQVFRTVASPGTGTTNTLDIKWNPNNGIILFKTESTYDGSYTIKIM